MDDSSNNTNEVIKITIDLGNGVNEVISVHKHEQNSYRRLA